MDTSLSLFEVLGNQLARSLTDCSGTGLLLHRYADGNTDTLTGFRTEVVQDGWTAGFFFWQAPPRLPQVHHMLEVRLQFQGVSSMVFPLYAVVQHLNPQDFRCCCLTDLASKEEMDAAVRWLWSILSEYRPQLDQLAKDPTPLEQSQRQALAEFFGEDIFDSSCADNTHYLHRRLRMWYVSFYERTTGEPYRNFLLGQFAPNLHWCRKHPPTNPYTVALHDYMATHDRLETLVLPPDLTAIMTRPPRISSTSFYLDQSQPKGWDAADQSEASNRPDKQPPASGRAGESTGTRSAFSPWFLFPDLMLGGLLLTPLWCAIYALLYTMDLQWATQGMQVVLGIDWLEVLLCAWITAFACAFCIAPQIIWLRYKRSPMRKKKAAAASRLNEPVNQRIFRIVVWVAVTFSAIHLFFYAQTGLAFSTKGFYDRSGTFDTRGTFYPYSQVLHLTRETSTVPLLGTSTDYVLTMKDGTTYYLTGQYGASANTVCDTIAPLIDDCNPDAVDLSALRAE